MCHHGVMDAYSEDLRRKIVEAVEERRMNQSEAARAFGVSLSSVKRYVKAVREGRSLSPGRAPGKRPTLDEKARKLLEADTWRSVRSSSSSTGRSTCARRPGCR
jgi:transposase